MLFSPLQNHTLRSGRNIALDAASFYFYSNFMIRVTSMKMGRLVVIVIHEHHNAEKT